ncbi:MAG TPA: response regulator transcription factor [Pseudonocardia sp.]|nr:response regulator transcription factor [Pseudonocardia sp.]
MFVPAQRSVSAGLPPTPPVLLALPPTAASASVARNLRAEGVAATCVGDGIALLDAVRAGVAALVVLDVELPGPEPAAVLSAMHAEAPHVPVVAVTPRERRSGLLGQLRRDQDDYVLRPFAVDELAARVRLRLRGEAPAATTVVRRGELTVDTEFGEVSIDGRPVALSPTEFAVLLTLLCAAPGEVVPAGRIACRVWSPSASANLVQVYVSYLRRKLGRDRIRTVRGGGYVLEV